MWNQYRCFILSAYGIKADLCKVEIKLNGIDLGQS